MGRPSEAHVGEDTLLETQRFRHRHRFGQQRYRATVPRPVAACLPAYWQRRGQPRLLRPASVRDSRRTGRGQSPNSSFVIPLPPVFKCGSRRALRVLLARAISDSSASTETPRICARFPIGSALELAQDQCRPLPLRKCGDTGMHRPPTFFRHAQFVRTGRNRRPSRPVPYRRYSVACGTHLRTGYGRSGATRFVKRTRPGRYVRARCHTRRNVSWAMSSASARLFVIR